MPITGLTDKGPNLPLFGTFYKGEAREECSKRFPKDLDYFRLEFEPQYQRDPKMAEAFISLYGEKPTEFHNIAFVAPYPDEVFPAWKEEYKADGLIHRCTGEVQVKHRDANGLNWQQIPCIAPQCACKNVGRLNFVLGDFSQLVGRLGMFRLITHSARDIITISGFLSGVFNARIASGNDLTGLLFMLGRAPVEMTVPDPHNPAKLIKTTKELCYMNLEASSTRRLGLADNEPKPSNQQRQALPTPNTSRPALPPPAAATKPKESVPDDREGLLNNGKAQKQFYKAVEERTGWKSPETTKRIIELGYALKDITHDQGMALLFPPEQPPLSDEQLAEMAGEELSGFDL